MRGLATRLGISGVDVKALIGAGDVDSHKHIAQIATEHERLEEEDALEHSTLGSRSQSDARCTSHLHVPSAREDDAALHDVISNHRQQRALRRRAERVGFSTIRANHATLDEWVRSLAPHEALAHV